MDMHNDTALPTWKLTEAWGMTYTVTECGHLLYLRMDNQGAVTEYIGIEGSWLRVDPRGDIRVASLPELRFSREDELGATANDNIVWCARRDGEKV